MWHAARAQDKKIKSILFEQRKRGERRRAYYEARAGDPRQMLRVLGTAVQLHADADQYFQNERLDTLVPLQGDKDLRVDRFDGRGLLAELPDEVPTRRAPTVTVSAAAKYNEPSVADMIQLERFRDLVEKTRVGVTEAAHLDEVAMWWETVFDRSYRLREIDAAFARRARDVSKNKAAIAYDYGKEEAPLEAAPAPASAAEEDEDASEAAKETKLLEYVNNLSDADALPLDKVAAAFGVRDYCRQLRGLRRQRLETAEAKKRRGGRRYREQEEPGNRSPVYGRYGSSSDDDEGDGRGGAAGEAGLIEYITEFGAKASTGAALIAPPAPPAATRPPGPPAPPAVARPPGQPAASSAASAAAATPGGLVKFSNAPKKLTPLERLKERMREGLSNSIEKDKDAERRKLQERREQQRLEYEQEIDREQQQQQQRQRRRRSRSRSQSRSRSRSRSRSPPRRDRRESRSRSRSPARSSRRRSRSRSRSPPPPSRSDRRR